MENKNEEKKEEIKQIDETKLEEITELIYIASRDLEAYQANYEFASDDLIDYFSYKIKAEKAKLDYLVKLAKSKEVVKEDIRAFALKFRNDAI